jgi:hypothetical protein
MAKHLGSRGQTRLSKAPRGLVWGLVALVAVSTATVGVVVHGIGSRSVDVHLAGSGPDAAAAVTRADDRARPAQRAVATRRPEVSRQSHREKQSPFRVRPGQVLQLTTHAEDQRKAAAMTPATSTFTIAQSNILGSQHTRGADGYGSGTYRAGITASLLISRGADVGGMQEVQTDQLHALQARMPGYGFWPATSLGNNGQRLQIYWRDSQFSLEDTGHVTYLFSGQHIPLPYVLLRDRTTGAEFWVITTHNSAGGMEGERDYSTGVEIALIHQLEATGKPVLITGDMNEHTEFFCRVSAATGMVAANGGSGVGGCHLPPNPLRVDWIMGRGVSFSGYRQDAAGLHRASDHYYLYATAVVSSRFYAP